MAFVDSVVTVKSRNSDELVLKAANTIMQWGDEGWKVAHIDFSEASVRHTKAKIIIRFEKDVESVTFPTKLSV